MENFEQVQTEVKEIKKKVTQIYTALVGNELAGDGGMVKRLTELEMKVHNLQRFKDRITWTMAIIASMSAAFGFLIQLIIQAFLK